MAVGTTGKLYGAIGSVLITLAQPVDLYGSEVEFQMGQPRPPFVTVPRGKSVSTFLLPAPFNTVEVSVQFDAEAEPTEAKVTFADQIVDLNEIPGMPLRRLREFSISILDADLGQAEADIDAFSLTFEIWPPRRRDCLLDAEDRGNITFSFLQLRIQFDGRWEAEKIGFDQLGRVQVLPLSPHRPELCPSSHP